MKKIPEVLNQVETDDHGAAYRIHEGQYNDEYDDTYDDALEKSDIDPLNLQAARSRLKNESSRFSNELPANPNIRIREVQEETGSASDSTESRTSSAASSYRDSKVSAPRAAYQRKKPGVETATGSEQSTSQTGSRNRKLNENSTKLEKKRKDANKAKVANHNRKQMADRKRNKGMI